MTGDWGVPKRRQLIDVGFARGDAPGKTVDKALVGVFLWRLPAPGAVG